MEKLRKTPEELTMLACCRSKEIFRKDDKAGTRVVDNAVLFRHITSTLPPDGPGILGFTTGDDTLRSVQ